MPLCCVPLCCVACCSCCQDCCVSSGPPDRQRGAGPQRSHNQGASTTLLTQQQHGSYYKPYPQPQTLNPDAASPAPSTLPPLPLLPPALFNARHSPSHTSTPTSHTLYHSPLPPLTLSHQHLTPCITLPPLSHTHFSTNTSHPVSLIPPCHTHTQVAKSKKEIREKEAREAAAKKAAAEYAAKVGAMPRGFGSLLCFCLEPLECFGPEPSRVLWPYVQTSNYVCDHHQK